MRGIDNLLISLFDFLPPIVNFIISIIGLVFGIMCFVSGIRKERKSFTVIFGMDNLVKNPLFNIIYGIFLILCFGFLVFGYLSTLI